VQQGTDEWLAARCGKVTASRLHEVVARLKSGGWGASRANYMADIVAERLTGFPVEQYVSVAMARGSELEPEARAAYALITDENVVEVGFIQHPHIAMSGASPDGLVGNDGLVEFKCPNIATHIGTLLGASIDGAYLTQMQWQMACADRRWCDWVSWCPILPVPMRMVCKRVERDDDRIEKLTAAVVEFLREVDAVVGDLRSLYLRDAA
jgi:putative phage-type endonuclease